MYVKLNFSADKPLNYIFRVVNEIINTSGITSIATLQSTATANSWDASLLSSLDAANSEIIRTGTGVTALTSNTKSHYAKAASPSATYGDQHYWTVEFSNYDDSTKKYYIQQMNASGATNISTNIVANAIASGSMSSGSFPANAPPLSTTANTPVILGGTLLNSFTANSVYFAQTTSGFSNVRTFIMFITDKSLVWCTTNAVTYNVGFGSTYSNAATYSGPWIFNQYTRFDYHNTNNNGIVPLMFTNTARVLGGGFGQSTNDWSNTDNVMATAQTSQAFRVMNLVNAYPQTGSSWPIVATPTVNWGCGLRYNDYVALNSSALGTQTTPSAQSVGAPISNTVSYRVPSADLKTQNFAMYPITWRHVYYYNAGGDSSAQTSVYLFNGDYYPGDEFTYSGKTYKILPTWTGYSARVGIAIPKE